MTDEPDDDKLARWIADMKRLVDAMDRDIQQYREVDTKIVNLNGDNDFDSPASLWQPPDE